MGYKKTSLIVLIFCVWHWCYALPNNTKLNQIHQLKQKLTQEKSQRNQLQKKLGKNEVRIGQLNKAITSLTKKIKQQQLAIKQLGTQNDTLQAQLSAQQVMLAKQIRAAYLLGRNSELKLLLNQRSPTLVDRNWTYFGYLNQARLKIMSHIDNTLQSLANNKRQLQQHIQALTALLSKQRQQQKVLVQYQVARQAVVAKLDTAIQNHSQRLHNLTRNAQQLEAIVGNLTQRRKGNLLPKRSFAAMRGQLSWPVTGKLRQYFGQYLLNHRLRSNGVIIAARLGQAVRAIYPGKVVFANWLSGFGLLIIVAHGKHYLTLYGHNQSLYKKVGDSVKVGDIIATVGKSGGYQHAGLYFAIRKNGIAVNPRRWLKTG